MVVNVCLLLQVTFVCFFDNYCLFIRSFVCNLYVIYFCLLFDGDFVSASVKFKILKLKIRSFIRERPAMVK